MNTTRRCIHFAGTACCLIALASCSGGAGPGLKRIEARGTLVVLTLNTPTTWYIGATGQPTGPEFQTVTTFAKSLGVKPKFVFRNSASQLLHALALGEGDMIAAGITHTDVRAKKFDF